MTKPIVSRAFHALNIAARPLARLVSRFVGDHIETRMEPRDQRVERLERNLLFTMRAFAAQTAHLSPAVPAVSLASEPQQALRVSILIATDTRTAATENLLHCLQYLDGPEFEVIVIRGPADDGMTAMLQRWEGAIKIAQNPERNISISRNLGAKLASGDIIALIDDDGLPERHWLDTILAAFDDPLAGGAGGAEVEYPGKIYNHPYLSMNRLGRMEFADESLQNASFPLGFTFPFARGLNCAFRREAFFQVGGFDEEYEYHFDEADLCCRIVDAGWHVRQLPDAIVHHKKLASHIRDSEGIIRDWFTPLKGKLYFSLRNNKGHYHVREAITDWHAYVRERAQDLRDQLKRQKRSDFDFSRYQADAMRAYQVGLQRGLTGDRRLVAAATAPPPPFLAFPRINPPQNREAVIIACEKRSFISPARAQASEIATQGHHVYLIIPADGLESVDFETCFWLYQSTNVKQSISEVTTKWNISCVHLFTTGSGSHWLGGLIKKLRTTQNVIECSEIDEANASAGENHHSRIMLSMRPTAANLA